MNKTPRAMRRVVTSKCPWCGGPSSRQANGFYACDGAYPHLCDGKRRQKEATVYASEHELIYRSYTWQRREFPDIAPERWMTMFGEHVTQMEERFQNEKMAWAGALSRFEDNEERS